MDLETKMCLKGAGTLSCCVSFIVAAGALSYDRYVNNFLSGNEAFAVAGAFILSALACKMMSDSYTKTFKKWTQTHFVP